MTNIRQQARLILDELALFAQNTQRRTQEAIQFLTASENISEKSIQEFGEDLSEQLGQIIEAKIIVGTVKNRLER
jgi:hypothetical protein